MTFIHVPVCVMACILPMTSMADKSFCFDDLVDVKLQFDDLPRMRVLEQGTAQGVNVEDGFVNVDVFLGEDGQGYENQLEQPESFALQLQAECREIVSNCNVIAITSKNFSGYKEQSTHSGITQTKWRIPLAGDLLTLRITASDNLSSDLSSAGEVAWAAVTEQMLPPC